MAREYPTSPVVGVGGVVIDNGRALLIRRGSEPLRGQWSIPGGMLELGESLQAGVARELLEETGLEVRVLDLIEVFDRIYTEETSLAETPVPASLAGVGVPPDAATSTNFSPAPDAATHSESAARSAAPVRPDRTLPNHRPRYHYVIVDYLCERISGEPRAGSDVTDVAFAREDELPQYHLTETATRVLRRAFAMAASRHKPSAS